MQELYQEFRPRLQGAQLEGFEGVKKLSLSLNKKRESLGLKPISIEEHYVEELELRKKDQEELFLLLLKMPIEDSQLISKTPGDLRLSRIANIKCTQFIVPSPEAEVEKVTLADCIPYMDQSQSFRKEQMVN